MVCARFAGRYLFGGILQVSHGGRWGCQRRADLLLSTCASSCFAQRTVDVQPFDCASVPYLVLPVMAGHLPLPTFSITSQLDQVQLLRDEDNYEVFVVPHAADDDTAVEKEGVSVGGESLLVA